ncbi:MAG TPA: hypothetical protein VHB20_02115 [Verrucomicrobiae bacterium]|jgi:hypothetical protein|nr:hypothetical protein [Verrucomicrobiae bacterium]
MKKINIILSALSAAALVGCASSSNQVVTQPVGPDLAPPRVNVGAGQGRLVVYTAREMADPVAYFPAHGAYKIYRPDGSLVSRVDNRTGTFDQEPPAVVLPVGKYKIEGHATNAGDVTVPVVVAENKTTIVDLEGNTLTQRKPTGAGQYIRLPDGKVIGMRVE